MPDSASRPGGGLHSVNRGHANFNKLGSTGFPCRRIQQMAADRLQFRILLFGTNDMKENLEFCLWVLTLYILSCYAYIFLIYFTDLATSQNPMSPLKSVAINGQGDCIPRPITESTISPLAFKRGIEFFPRESLYESCKNNYRGAARTY